MMKKSMLYIAGLITAAAAFQACDDNFETPPLVAPSTDLVANTTIAELKEAYWQTDRNYVSEVGTDKDGNHVIIKGRVCSSDEAGNIYKNFVIYDGSAALTVAVDTTKLYTCFHYGQEVVIDVTGLKLGGYNSLMQLGAEGAYNGNPSMTFMSAATMREHCFAAGLASPSKVEVAEITLAELAALGTSQETLISWQSRLVRVKGVSFKDAGKTFAEPSTNTNRYLTDGAGHELLVRNSGYATFASNILPSGTGDVEGILSYYGTDWQMLLINAEGCIGFDGSDDPNPTPDPIDGDGNGTADAPYTVSQVIGGASGSAVWVTGYIVGWIADKSFSSSVIGGDATVNTNILLADAADVTDYNKCIPVQLTAGSIRSTLNLVDHADNLGKQVAIKGSIEAYFGVPGLKSPTMSVWGDKGEEATTANYTKVSAITAGKSYLIVASDGSAAAGTIAEGNEYGYLPKAEVSVNGNTAEAPAGILYTFEATDGGYYIKDALGRYLWMDETHASYQVSATVPSEAGVWTVTASADGTFTVANVARNKTMQYSTQYKSWGAYPDSQGLLPMMFEKAN